MRILRFGITARVLHWSHGIVFIWLLITGIQIFLTPKSLLGDPLIKMIHLYASPLFVFLPGIIYFFGRRYIRHDLKDLMSWNKEDLRWFTDFLKKNKTLVIGKFNGGQKVNFMTTLLLILGLSFSGSVIWMKSMFNVDFVELNFLIHDFFAILSALLLTMHTILALYNNESLRGIIYGAVDEKWAEKHYPRWFKQASKSK